MISFDIIASSLGSEAMRSVYAKMEDRSGLHETIAAEGEELTRNYLLEISAYRHKTANTLGATPTGALEKAAQRVTSKFDNEEATVVVWGNLFARAFQDITITPQNSKYLTIPINAISYGRRVKELEAEGWIFFLPQSGTTRPDFSSIAANRNSDRSLRPILWATNPAGESMPMYVLATSVYQEQDRSLLPSDEEYMEAGQLGAFNYLDRLLTEV